MVDMARVRLFELAEQAARVVTEDDGSFNAKAHEEEVVRLLGSVKLTPQSADLLRRQTAKKLCEQFIRNRSPRRRNVESAIPTLYSDGYILVLPDKIRRWMTNATPSDLQTWKGMAEDRATRSSRAYEERTAYIEDRMNVWRGRPDIQNLGELERHFFNYQNQTIDSDFEDDTDNDE